MAEVARRMYSMSDICAIEVCCGYISDVSSERIVQYRTGSGDVVDRETGVHYLDVDQELRERIAIRLRVIIGEPRLESRRRELEISIHVLFEED